MKPHKVAIVTGATGMNGSAVIEYLINSKDCSWKVIGIARKLRKDRLWWGHPNVTFLSIDLSKAVEIEKVLSQESETRNVTHIFCSTYNPGKDEMESIIKNVPLLKNIVQYLDNSPYLENITLVTGAKYYGVHVGAFKTPAEETDPRHKGINFYFDQEDFLCEFQKGKSWNYNVIRPNGIIGFSQGAMNIAVTLAVYATLCKETGRPLKFPGTYKSYHQLYDCTNADLVGEMFEWLALSNSSQTKNQVFNCVNGDAFRWTYLWPKVGQLFDIEIEEPMEGQPPYKLSENFQDTDCWDVIVEKYNLKSYQLDELVTWKFTEWLMSREYDSVISMNKAKGAGFLGWRCSEKSILGFFYSLATNGIIPMYPTFND